MKPYTLLGNVRPTATGNLQAGCIIIVSMNLEEAPLANENLENFFPPFLKKICAILETGARRNLRIFICFGK